MNSPGDKLQDLEQEALPLDADERWKLALRVAQSSGFQKATRLREFLLYTCEKTLTHHEDEVREQLIAVEVFRRPPDYNPAEDNIVRVEARELRKRLDLYFLTEGKAEPLRIRIPKGAYVPCFAPNGPGTARVFSPSLRRGWGAQRWILGIRTEQGLFKAFKAVSSILLGVLVVVLLVPRLVKRGSTGATPRRLSVVAPATFAGAIWPTLFPSSNTLQVVVSDGGLPVMERTNARVIQLADYLNGKYIKELESPRFPPIMFQPYTSFADTMAAVEIAKEASAQGKRIALRYPRDLSIRDIANDDMVFLGSSYSDPWINEFNADRDFVLTVVNGPKGRLCYSNKSPRGLEKKRYCTEGKSYNTGEGYGLITFVPNLQSGGHVLILEGTDMQGTEATADFIVHLHPASEIYKYLGLPVRTSLPYFQLLLKANVIGAAPGKFEVIAYRILSPSRP